MSARQGQVAIYLVLALVAVCLLVLVDLNVFLAVRSKNRMMNAVDEAAIAVAKRQGDLLNRLGRMNAEHLRAAVLGPVDGRRWCEAGSRDPADNLVRMRDLVFLGPIEEGSAAGNASARQWGFSDGGADAGVYADHLSEIENQYAVDYPEYRDGLWTEYAKAFSEAVGGTVMPDYIETANAWTTGGPQLTVAFYDAIASKSWCWFTVGSRARYLDDGQPPLVRVVQETVENSEVYSLHVTFKTWMESAWADEYVPGVGFSARWTNFVCRVTGLSEADFSKSSYADDPDEVWAFYDDYWQPWSKTFNPENYPIAGTVKPPYDVAGCVASCRMVGDIQQLDDDGRPMEVTAEAKPFGTVEDLDGWGEVPVTAYGAFIAPSRPGGRIFTEAQLVLMRSVPRAPGVSLEPAWYEHVRHHLNEDGFSAAGGCRYCRLLLSWENGQRDECRRWLETHAGSCRVEGSGADAKGGYDCAH